MNRRNRRKRHRRTRDYTLVRMDMVQEQRSFMKGVRIALPVITAVTLLAAAMFLLWGVLAKDKPVINASQMEPQPLEMQYVESLPEDTTEPIGTETPIESVGPSESVEPSESEEPQKEKTQRLIPLVIIDPGHGGYDVGCNYGDIYEKDINLSIALETEAYLKNLGYEVLLTRSDDTHLYVEERSEIANTAEGDICISIHQNDYAQMEEVHGAETLYESEESRVLATSIQSNMMKYIETRDRGIKFEDTLHMLHGPLMPSCLIEAGFITNNAERNNLTNPEYQKNIARGIAEGIDRYFEEMGRKPGTEP